MAQDAVGHIISAKKHISLMIFILKYFIHTCKDFGGNKFHSDKCCPNFKDPEVGRSSAGLWDGIVRSQEFHLEKCGKANLGFFD